MSFQFVVEDGTGYPEANSYVDVDYILEFAEFWDHPELESLPEEQLERMAIRSSQWLDRQLDWRSDRLNEQQGLAFPRKQFRTKDGRLIEAVPDEIQQAVVYAILATNAGFDFNAHPKYLKSQAFGGASETYFGAYKSGGNSELDAALDKIRFLGLGEKGLKQVALERG